jgi:nucleotidyltransferase/DNA polymerase involved in DNA repair
MPSFPRAILHIDADAFFASVETAVNPALKGKPVAVVNAHLGNRAIVLTANYLARPFGVKTGVRYVDAKRLCPHAVFVPVSMHTYGIYSLRIANILRRFSPTVEEASVDEWFADLTGLRRIHQTSYRGIAQQVQKAVERELGLTVSCGIATSKTLAKIASDFQKPKGLTLVPVDRIEEFLGRCDTGAVPGFGPNSQALLRQYGCLTALDVARLPEERIKALMGKRGHDLWRELHGEAVGTIVTTPPRQQSLSHCRTFIELVSDRTVLFAEVELVLLEASARLRRHGFAAKELWLRLREADFRTAGAAVRFQVPTSNEALFIDAVQGLFRDLYRPGPKYRLAEVGFGGLVDDVPAQLSLFDSRENQTIRVLPAVDELNAAFGNGTVTRAGALPAHPKDKAFVGTRQGRRLSLPTIE